MKRIVGMSLVLAALALFHAGGCGGSGGKSEGHSPLIPAGIDCWFTPCGRTQANFCGLPLPVGFFEPGSDPFDGVIRLQGAGGAADTQVSRLQDMTLPNLRDQKTVPIELVQLNLVSCEPIIVETQLGPTQWDVEVTLSDFPPQQQGQMTVTKTHRNGGTFVSELIVQPKFTFTKVGTQDVRVLDTGDPRQPMAPNVLHLLGEAPWVHELKPPLAGAFTPCGVNFVPGVREDPVSGEQCCGETCHADPSGLSTHCTAPPNCQGCPDGACCFAGGSCQDVSATSTQTAGQVCEALGGEYKGDGTECATDTDVDGLPDVTENGDCCGLRDACNHGTNPANPDTDSDGYSDGLEVQNGTDPCDPLDY